MGRGERRRGRGLEGSCFVLFTNPSLASIVQSRSLHSGCSGTPCDSSSPFPGAPLPSPPLPYSNTNQCPLESNIISHTYLLSPNASTLKSVWTSVILPFSWQSPPHSHVLFICHHNAYSIASICLLKNEQRQVRKPGHYDTQKTSLSWLRLLKHVRLGKSEPVGQKFQPWHSGAWKCWRRSNKLPK